MRIPFNSFWGTSCVNIPKKTPRAYYTKNISVRVYSNSKNSAKLLILLVKNAGLVGCGTDKLISANNFPHHRVWLKWCYVKRVLNIRDIYSLQHKFHIIKYACAVVWCPAWDLETLDNTRCECTVITMTGHFAPLSR